MQIILIEYIEQIISSLSANGNDYKNHFVNIFAISSSFKGYLKSPLNNLASI